MAIGYTGSDGNIQEFSYTPVDPQDEMMRQAFEQSQAAFNPPPPQPNGPTPYWENPTTYYPRQQQIDPIDQAKAATAAAYKYIAFRGYQQDLKEGKSAADAFAKWGPMLVQDVSFAPAMKAMRPPTGRWVAPNPSLGQPGYYEGEGPSGIRAYYPPEGIAQRPDVNPSEHVQMVGGNQVYVNPRTGALTKLDKKSSDITPTAALNIISDPQKWAFAQDALGPASSNLVSIAKSAFPTEEKAAEPTSQETTAAPPESGPPTVTSKAEFDKLPPGAVYINKGKMYQKRKP